MKLISWNCQGAFRKKADKILELQPDILVIQECEHPEKLKFSPTTPKPNFTHWYSDGGKKGIAIFSYSDYKFELLPEFNPEFRYILPFRLIGNRQTYTFFAIWAMDNKENYEARYIGQVWLAMNHYSNLLDNSTIIIGDFNSNKIWDYKDRVGNHSSLVNNLKDKEIHSVYHEYFKEEQGKEKQPTLYMYRKKEKPYHIDYCFVSANLLDKIKEVEVGTHEEWTTHSDHSPLSIEFES